MTPTSTTPTSQVLRIVGPNLPSQATATFHVHAAGCADLTRGWIRNCSDGWTATYQDEFHFAPCVTVPLEASEAVG